MYHSQTKQDVLLDRNLFRGERDLVFVDVGAHDGEVFSSCSSGAPTKGSLTPRPKFICGGVYGAKLAADEAKRKKRTE